MNPPPPKSPTSLRAAAAAPTTTSALLSSRAFPEPLLASPLALMGNGVETNGLGRKASVLALIDAALEVVEGTDAILAGEEINTSSTSSGNANGAAHDSPRKQ